MFQPIQEIPVEINENDRAVLIVIDGQSGAGKGTLASSLAFALSLLHWDSGAIYRAVGLHAEDTGKDPIEVARKFGEAIRHHADLRTDRGGMAASRVSQIPEVRIAVNDFMKQELATPPGYVVDGRSGAWEFPESHIKIFLSADLDERAHRRCRLLLKQTGSKHSFNEVRDNLFTRDAEDSNREIFPLKRHPDAFSIDNTELEPQQTFLRAIRRIVKELYVPQLS